MYKCTHARTQWYGFAIDLLVSIHAPSNGTCTCAVPVSIFFFLHSFAWFSFSILTSFIHNQAHSISCMLFLQSFWSLLSAICLAGWMYAFTCCFAHVSLHDFKQICFFFLRCFGQTLCQSDAILNLLFLRLLSLVLLLFYRSIFGTLSIYPLRLNAKGERITITSALQMLGLFV